MGEHGGNQANDLPIFWIVVTVNELNGIAGEVFFFGKLLDKTVQVALKRGH